MRTRIYAVDGDSRYASISFIPDEADALTNQELIDLINSKNKRKEIPMRKVFIGTDTQWFGPQRYAKDTGAFLEQTNEEGFWVDPLTNTVYHIDDVQNYPLSNDELPKKVRTELNAEESSWLYAHEQYLLEDNDPFWTEFVKCSFKEEVNDDNGEVVSHETKAYDVMISKENTEMTLEECKFWRRISWLIGHSPKKALEYCKQFSKAEWFDRETKEYVWELIKDDNTPKFKYAQFLMMQARKYIATHEQPIHKVYNNKKEELFTNFSWTRVPSIKYIGEYLFTLKARKKGEEISMYRVGKTRNWVISKGTLDHKEFNLFLQFAEQQVKGTK